MQSEAGPSSSPRLVSSDVAIEAALAPSIDELHISNGDAHDTASRSNGKLPHSNEAGSASSEGGVDTEQGDDRHPGETQGFDVADGIAANGIGADDVTSGGRGIMEDETMDPHELRAELARVRQERDSFEGQYRGLLQKLGQMRSTLGDRLRQDAEELDRREQQIESLTTRIEELEGTSETLKAELLGSHGDIERLSNELDAARSLQQQQTDSASDDRRGTEARLRELQEIAERYRMDAEGWESACMEERARRDDIDLEIREACRERDEARAREQEQASFAAREAETARELQQILEEFQAAQESDLQRALADHEEKLTATSTALEEHALRTREAEKTAQEYKGAAERCHTLEKDVKEKNLLIGKLRHEAVILNEHLTESLRRLKSNTSDSNVDGKLITNLLIQFLNTPRQDTKRFEMLTLIASVLHWSDDDRERAGLQKPQGNAASGDRKVGVSASAPPHKPGHRRQSAAAKGPSSPGGGEESFSNLFLEFLLSEAEQAKKPAATASGPASPKASAPSSPQSTIGRGAAATSPIGPESPSANANRPSFNLGSLASIGRPATGS